MSAPLATAGTPIIPGVVDPRREKVTMTEAARRLGTTKQNLTNLRRRHPAGFPPHDLNVVGVKVYSWPLLLAWWNARRSSL